MIGRFLKSLNPTMVVITVLMLIGLYRTFFVVSDHIGYSGADKNGRQQFIQYLNSDDSTLKYMDLYFDSDFKEQSVLKRFWVVPMRTTLIVSAIDSNYKFTEDGASLFLLLPSSIVTDWAEELPISENEKVSTDELVSLLEDNDRKTLGGLFEVMGFDRVIFKDLDGASIEIKLAPLFYSSVGF